MKSWDVHRKSFDVSPKYHFSPSSPSTNSSPLAVISNWTPSKPNITLYASPSSPILAVAHFHKLSSSIRIGIGDPDTPANTVQWTELDKKGLRGKEYRLTYQVSPDEPPREFVWRRTSMWVGRDFELYDEGVNGKGGKGLIAKFEGKRGWTGKVGRLEVGVEMGEEMEGMVIVTILGIQERIRRARNGSAAGGAAGA